MQLSVRVEGAELVRQGLQDLAAEIPKIGRLQIYRASQRIVKTMRQPGKKISYPVKWDSERQRRAYFATDGFGAGIPYRRDGSYEKGFEIKKIDTGHTIINRMPGAQFIGGNAYGQNQSNIHQGRWNILRDTVEDEIENLPAEIEQEITLVARRKGL